MVETYAAHFLSVTINRDWREVYDFACPPERFVLWASGLATSLDFDGSDWTAESPLGQVKIRFSERNSYGVLDHTVILPDGDESYNPFRVVANGTGAEVMFTLFRQPGTTDADFAQDAATVQRDLNALKALLESHVPNGRQSSR